GVTGTGRGRVLVANLGWHSVRLDLGTGRPLGDPQEGPKELTGNVRLTDLDGDGLPELVGPSVIVDGASGKERWRRQEPNNHDHPEYQFFLGTCAAGPDLDGDGWRDVFYASIAPGEAFGRPKKSLVLWVEARS